MDGPVFRRAGCVAAVGAGALFLLTALAASPDEADVRKLLDDGAFGEALALARELVAATERPSGDGSLAHARALDLLVEASLLAGSAREPRTRELAETAVALKRRLTGESSLETAGSLGRLGRLLTMIGSYDEARPILERALSIAEQESGEPPRPVLADNLNAVATWAWWMGEFERARDLWQRALSELERDLGPEHQRVGTMHANLALALEDLGDFAGALAAYEQAVRIGEANDPDDPRLALTLSNLGELKRLMGDLEGARRCHERALAIRLDKLGPEHQHVANSLNNLAIVERLSGNAGRAIELYEQSLAIKEKVLGPTHPQTANTLANLSHVYLDVGNLPAAERYARRSLAIREQTLGERHVDVAKSLASLSDVLLISGKLDEALEAASRCVAIREELLSEEHPLTAESLIALARIRRARGEVAAAADLAMHAEEIAREHLRATIRALTGSEALDYATHRYSALDLLVTIAIEAGGDSVAKAWDAVVRSRALVFDEMAGRARAIREATSGRTADALEAYRRATERLARLLLSTTDVDPGRYAGEVLAARAAKERTERLLASLSASFRSNRRRAGITIDDVRAALPPATSLVAYTRFARAAERGAEGPTPSYAAFVLGPGGSGPEIVPLGPARAIDDAVRNWRGEAAAGPFLPGRTRELAEREYRLAGQRLRELVWDPLREKIAGSERVLLVPDGSLHLVQFGALPGPGDSSRFLVEGGAALLYLSAERDVVEIQIEPLGKPASIDLLALGGADFGASPAAETKPAGSTFRGGRPSCRSFRDRKFVALPASDAEAREVASLWRRSRESHGLPRTRVDLLTGRLASEDNFKRSAPLARHAHVATHGFFLAGQCAADAGAAAAAENPLLLSGLVLAGANRRQTTPADRDDGILTAEEIGALDLGGMEWVVLSGCDTGLGEIRSGEGVLGLRRAFRIAGARTLVLSLWPVEDDASREWMQALYRRRLLDRAGVAEATRGATLEVLARRQTEGASTHPHFWAMFVASGEWR